MARYPLAVDTLGKLIDAEVREPDQSPAPIKPGYIIRVAANFAAAAPARDDTEGVVSNRTQEELASDPDVVLIDALESLDDTPRRT